MRGRVGEERIISWSALTLVEEVLSLLLAWDSVSDGSRESPFSLLRNSSSEVSGVRKPPNALKDGLEVATVMGR